MRVVITGGDGFLGWHTRVRLRAMTDHDVLIANRASWSQLADLTRAADVVIHIAGVNRGSRAEVEQGNISLARDLDDAIRAGGGRPKLIFANSIQAGLDTPYGVGKQAASDLLTKLATDIGSVYVNVVLPNLFGEHGRPQYNSFVATFVDMVVNRETPQILDRPVELLHVQRAAASLLNAVDSVCSNQLTPAGVPVSVKEIYQTLHTFDSMYATGDIPPLLTALDVDLFNTLRAARFPAAYPIPLAPQADHRGSLVEVVRVHGGQGQTFVSTTRSGITRGEHFHLSKVERFVVLSGRARISLRKMFTDDIIKFDVDGANPCIVDMPTMWVHNITNIDEKELTTLFWTNELFDANAPDTFPETVAPSVREDREGQSR